jgi:hypothetical protein
LERMEESKQGAALLLLQVALVGYSLLLEAWRMECFFPKMEF